MALVALLLSGAYSMTAALGSASGGRMNATAAEAATMDARSKAQAAYDAAKAELDSLAIAKPAGDLQSLIAGAQAELAKLPPARPAVEIDALIRGAAMRPNAGQGCTAINGSLRMSCPKLEAEKARAEQRERLTGKIAGWTTEVGQAHVVARNAETRIEPADRNQPIAVVRHIAARNVFGNLVR
jgi:multidrug efflux pump subunit AcrA (membrane-fusion protein)